MEQRSSTKWRNPLRIIHIIECILGVTMVFLIAFEPLLTRWNNWRTEMVHAVVDGFFLASALLAISYLFDAPIEGITDIITAASASVLFIFCIVLVALTFKECVHTLAVVSLVMAILLFIAWMADLVLHSLFRRRKLKFMRDVPIPADPLGPQPMVQTLPQAVGMEKPAAEGEGPGRPTPPSQQKKTSTSNAPGARRPGRRPGAAAAPARRSRAAPRSQDGAPAASRTSRSQDGAPASSRTPSVSAQAKK